MMAQISTAGCAYLIGCVAKLFLGFEGALAGIAIPLNFCETVIDIVFERGCP